MDYLYKVEIELDDEKIVSEGKYELANVYATIRNWFAEEHISEVKTDEHMLVFATKKFNKYAYIWVGINTVYLSAIKPYLKSVTWYNFEHEDDYCEDVLAAFREEGI